MEDIIKGIFVFGVGVSGKGVIKYCIENKIPVFVSDDNIKNTVSITSDAVVVRDVKNFDYSQISFCVISPGVPLNTDFPLYLRSIGVKMISDLELYKMVNKNVFIIGITGSNGKSTTASLLAFILKNLGVKAFLAGNIGISPFDESSKGMEVAVFEVSSYQLETTDFIFDVGLLLNITADHLERHGGMQGYALIKSKILKNSKFGVLGFDTSESAKLKEVSPDITLFSCQEFLKTGYSLLKGKLYKNGVLLKNNIKFENLRGEHNACNILACIIIAMEKFGFSLDDILREVATFKGLEHRIEFVREIDGVTFVNDSKATNADSCLTAIKTFQGKKVFLIAGGKAKEEGIETILNAPDFMKCVKEIFLIGEASGIFANRIIRHNKDFPSKVYKFTICGTLEKATKISFASAKKQSKSVVLLSPLCASFDQFKNFEERGQVFKKIVATL
jgi:UDP-N-acetylmuramoylalanine--D-glutamate ligase